MGCEARNILIVNFEEAGFDEELDEKFLLKIYESYKEYVRPTNKPLIILDEIQEVSRWEKFVRSLQEKKEADIIVTGSSSKLMSEELGTLLTGRALNLEIFPLDYTEFLKFKGFSVASRLEALDKLTEIKSLLAEYMEYGGFPEAVTNPDKDLKNRILGQYLDDILAKDIVKRYGIRRFDKLEKLARYYMTNTASPITYNSIANMLKIPDKTVEAYSRYMETARIFFFIRRFSYSVKEQEKSPRKVYSIDTGLANATGFRFTENKGRILENLVAVELRRRNENLRKYEVYYWKDQNGKEVDFVLKEGQKIKKLIQACYDPQDAKTTEREERSLLKASEELKCEDLEIITWDHSKERSKEDPIRHIPLWKWLTPQIFES